MAKRSRDSYRMDVRDLISFATVFSIILVMYCIYWFVRFAMREGFIEKNYWITPVPYLHELYRAQLPGEFNNYRLLEEAPVPM